MTRRLNSMTDFPVRYNGKLPSTSAQLKTYAQMILREILPRWCGGNPEAYHLVWELLQEREAKTIAWDFDDEGKNKPTIVDFAQYTDFTEEDRNNLARLVNDAQGFGYYWEDEMLDIEDWLTRHEEWKADRKPMEEQLSIALAWED